MNDYTSYNPIAAIKQLRIALYCIHKPKQVKSKYSVQAERTRLEQRRWARILIKDLKEYKKQFPDLYLKYKESV